MYADAALLWSCMQAVVLHAFIDFNVLDFMGSAAHVLTLVICSGQGF